MQPEDVKRVRNALTCSVGELAAALGVEVKTVLAWESGDLFPTKRHADRLKALEREGPLAIKRTIPKKPRATSGLDLLAEPRLWSILRKLLAHPDLLEKVERLSEPYADPATGRG